MGTLHSIAPRKYRTVDRTDALYFIEFIKSLAKDTDTPFDSVLKAIEVLELSRKNELFVDNGDIWDEQISGIGHILEDIAVNLGDLE